MEYKVYLRLHNVEIYLIYKVGSPVVCVVAIDGWYGEDTLRLFRVIMLYVMILSVGTYVYSS